MDLALKSHAEIPGIGKACETIVHREFAQSVNHTLEQRRALDPLQGGVRIAGLA